jgi:hypothetical protein
MSEERIPGLLDEPPINIYPSLAKRAGINKAAILQQLHFLLKITEKAHLQKNYIDGEWWVYNTYAGWQREHFPWLSVRTVQRLFLELEKDGIIRSRLSPEDKDDQTKYYTIVYEQWNVWFRADSSQKEMGAIPKRDGGGVERRPISKRDAHNNESENTQRLPAENPAEIDSPTSTDSANSARAEQAAGPPDGGQAASKPTPTRSKKSDTIPKALMDPMKDAIAAACGWSWATMTDSEKGTIQRAAKELCKAGVTASDVPGLHQFCASRYQQFGPMALASSLSAYRKGETTHERPRDSRAGGAPQEPRGKNGGATGGAGIPPGAPAGTRARRSSPVPRPSEEDGLRLFREAWARRERERASEQSK